MAAVEKVTFTIRRPTPVSRGSSVGVESDSGFKVPSLPRRITHTNGSGSPLARSTSASPAPPPRHPDSDSSDEGDDEVKDELVTGFDRFGVQRFNRDNRPRPSTDLVIPALQNRDWREIARKRKTARQFVPMSATAQTGTDGSVGGLGTRDSINSGPVLSGLQIKKQVDVKIPVKQEEGKEVVREVDMETSVQAVKKEEDGEEDEEKRALRAILYSVNGQQQHDGPVIDVISTPISEADAYKQDVDELPESSTLADYERVPVSQFGAALLRGMGWKEGTAVTKQPGKGLVEPYLPLARPALLGIGAKEQDLYDDGSKKNKNKRPEKRYVPLVKIEMENRSHEGSVKRNRERSRSPPSRRRSRSRDPGLNYDDKRRRSERDRDRSERDRDYKRGDYDRDQSYRERGRDRSRESNRRRV